MKTQGRDKLTVYAVALLVLALFCGGISTMVAIASHECQGPSCIESVPAE